MRIKTEKLERKFLFQLGHKLFIWLRFFFRLLIFISRTHHLFFSVLLPELIKILLYLLRNAHVGAHFNVSKTIAVELQVVRTPHTTNKRNEMKWRGEMNLFITIRMLFFGRKNMPLDFSVGVLSIRLLIKRANSRSFPNIIAHGLRHFAIFERIGMMLPKSTWAISIEIDLSRPLWYLNEG